MGDFLLLYDENLYVEYLIYR